jgi:hypothetical protein
MKTKIVTLFFVFTTSVLIVVGLFINSTRINNDPNHFTRVFAPHVQNELKAYNIGSKIWYISGINRSTISFTHKHYLNALLTINLKSFDTAMSILSVPHYALKKPTISKGENDLYILDGELPAIYKASLNNLKAPRLVNSKCHFDVALPMGDSLFVVRFLNKKNEFALGQLRSNRITEAPELLQGKGDGIMSKDGMLLTDHINKKIVYVHYYRNEYVVADHNMKLLYRGKTKDTVSIAKIKVGKPDKDGNVIMASPPVITNKLAALHNNYLFVNSALLADNEKKEFFTGSSVIDVYDISKGLYKFSFYIPDYKNKKIKEFNVFGDKLAAMFEDQCVIYKLNQKYFK